MSLVRPSEIVGAFALAVTVAAGQAQQPPSQVTVVDNGNGACAVGQSACVPRWHGAHGGGEPVGSIDLPLGATVYAPMEIQIANAQAARLALYHYDFFEGSAVLTPRGRDRLHEIAALLPACFAPVVVERTIWTPELDTARRAMVYNELSQLGFPLPPERVVVGVPTPIGWRGVEADIVYHNLLIQTLAGGAGRGTGTSSPTGGGFSAAGGGSNVAPTSH
jgi:hypothetical protein